jgi:hypothetical protein
MASTIFPARDLDLINFCQQKAALWGPIATSIGLTNAQVAEFALATTDAARLLDAAEAARASSKAATSAARAAIGTLRRTGGTDVKAIRVFAARQEKPQNVYDLAQIPAPEPRGGSVPPIAPDRLTASLDFELGQMIVRWRITQPKGISNVVYRVERNTGTNQAWTQVGLVGGKSFVDDNFPTVAVLRYRVFAQRGNLASGPSPILEINFGDGAGVGGIRTSMKLAA